MSTTQNKNLNHLLNLLVSCISAISAPQMLSLKSECTFLILNFLITDLCNASANSLLEMISFLTVPSDVFYQKVYKPLKQCYVDIRHILDS